jgi:hypothetical protein
MPKSPLAGKPAPSEHISDTIQSRNAPCELVKDAPSLRNPDDEGQFHSRFPDTSSLVEPEYRSQRRWQQQHGVSGSVTVELFGNIFDGPMRGHV